MLTYFGQLGEVARPQQGPCVGDVFNADALRQVIQVTAVVDVRICQDILTDLHFTQICIIRTSRYTHSCIKRLTLRKEHLIQFLHQPLLLHQKCLQKQSSVCWSAYMLHIYLSSVTLHLTRLHFLNIRLPFHKRLHILIFFFTQQVISLDHTLLYLSTFHQCYRFFKANSLRILFRKSSLDSVFHRKFVLLINCN